ncbi:MULTISPECIES: helix-turn-helix domain-containing protein [Carnobacterium]|uniref:HTH cro/C1-type domain-containing protein n=2 Tax=Carnobacterium divergens TaxID=2748 RepID=A0A0R2HYD2_CARDV|nr:MULTISPECIES: helix-turn-helix domain-containing protein [Carnobacterium]AOA00573.1 hypothetical protein BFC22_10935 [Carnobacterium divergens]KRN57826.1 hypothetical protein IV74_GL001081 [Carnobacterium divergens DSM 20623]MCO6017066.1 helix-turn-helix transcriptional regulator [Carnobacterium divergens]MDO0874457.1 helix-turn-helix transcriptional regulator [Carnobacterium divergens]MDT1940400.1 helix-turn-helix transcriptional regulator [Carnobacterium divergens]
MIILGDKVKKLRIEKKLTQSQLAEGICTQVTISKIENHNNIPTMNILSKICDRLGAEINDVCIVEGDSNTNYNLFKKVDTLCNQLQHKEAYDLLVSSINEDELDNIHDKKLYYYYVGITRLIGFNEFEEALHYFNLELILERSSNLDFVDVLVTNSIGIAYDSKNDIKKAKVYFDKSIDDIQELNKVEADNFTKLLKIYYNAAKFYSKIEIYDKAISLSDIGIDLLQKDKSYYMLDFLYYEKGFNLLKKGNKKEAEEFYFLAMACAIMNGNDNIVTGIKEDIKQYKLTPYKF